MTEASLRRRRQRSLIISQLALGSVGLKERSRIFDLKYKLGTVDLLNLA
jgi:hypothetical protein